MAALARMSLCGGGGGGGVKLMRARASTSIIGAIVIIIVIIARSTHNNITWLTDLHAPSELLLAAEFAAEQLMSDTQCLLCVQCRRPESSRVVKSKCACGCCGCHLNVSATTITTTATTTTATATANTSSWPLEFAIVFSFTLVRTNSNLLAEQTKRLTDRPRGASVWFGLPLLDACDG